MNVYSSLNRANKTNRFTPETVDITKSHPPRRRSLGAGRSAKRRPQRHPNRRTNPSSQGVWLDAYEQDRLLRQRSLEEAKQGNYLLAVEGLSVLIDRNPENATDYNNRGLVQFQWGQREAALEDYNRAIALNPKLASAYNNRANHYATQGLLAEAIADYEMAIDLDPTNVRAWLNQGITFRDLEMYPQAIENFEQALHISELLTRSPKDSCLLDAHIYAARGRTHHIIGDWNYAIADYCRALDRLPERSPKRLYTQVTTWIEALRG
ncbi:tetratricopeptide repeat protein [Myxacorys almedinensis]|uniref:Tetratricopeptide repeat protein n=1 Tax=Myxacorys almedinensis A TaxID=2690445 RepID=A0A8J7YZP7_9CYAN|nr:tetratricopeptide repeat protein [Myxacorys almedinensis]NDJ17034.1 tetratricopeptide repeat protein [Myxacorys almedinensis A]